MKDDITVVVCLWFLFVLESEIYEDPAVRYEGAAANPDPLDMEGYLVCQLFYYELHQQ